MGFKISKGRVENFAVVWLVLASGTVMYAKYNMLLCMAILVVLGTLLLVFLNKLSVERSNFNAACLLVLFGTLTCWVNGFKGFSINDFLIFVGEVFFLMSLCSAISFKKFQRIFIETIYIITIISLICFVFVVIFPTVRLPFEMHIERLNWTGTFYYTLGFGWGRSFRNAGIFGEGGVFQIFLNMALFFLIHSDDELKRKKIKIVVLVIGVLTTVSSIGYIALVLVLMSLLVKNESQKARYYILCFLAIACIVIIDSSIGLLTEKIINQQGSFGSRYDDTLVSLLVANDHPLFGHGISNEYLSAWEVHVNSPLRITNPKYVQLQRSSGIGLIAMRCGYPFLIVFILRILGHIRRSFNKGWLIGVLGGLVMILGCFNEPMQFTPFYLMAFFVWKKEDAETSCL